MSSLSDVQEIYELLTKIDELLTHTNTQMADVFTYDITGRQILRLMYRLEAVMKRLGLPPQIEAALKLMSRATMVARELMMTMTFLEMDTPYGLVMGILGLAMVGFTGGQVVSDVAYDLSRGS